MAKEEKLINNNNKHENSKQVEYTYEVGHYLYILSDGNYKNLEGEKLGTFRITQLHTHGSVRIRRVIINEQINIWHLTPNFEDTPTQDLVLSHCFFRLLGLGCLPCLLSHIRF